MAFRRSKHPDGARNFTVFDSDAVADFYSTLDEPTLVERHLADQYIGETDSVLDLGVGAGRTTPLLAGTARRYVGADIAPKMIERARAKHPGHDFVVADAIDLSAWDDGQFDVVFFSFNGLDYIVEPGGRDQALSEIARVLNHGGRFIFSAHDPRAILRSPQPGLGSKAKPIAVVQTARRIISRVVTRAFWTGSGVVNEASWGGLDAHMTTPKLTKQEMEGYGFRIDSIESCDFPRRSARWSTEWWYYVCVLADGPQVSSPTS